MAEATVGAQIATANTINTTLIKITLIMTLPPLSNIRKQAVIVPASHVWDGPLAGLVGLGCARGPLNARMRPRRRARPRPF